MSGDSLIKQEANVISFFHRHVVPIYFCFKKKDVQSSCLITAFVMSINDQWFLITAGHCIEDIDTNISNGYEIERCRLIDSLGLGASYKEPIPFDYYASAATKLCYDPKYDYGIIFVDDVSRAQLQANGIVALTEEVWEMQPDGVDFYALIGVPSQLSSISCNDVKIVTTLHRVTEYLGHPACFEETDAPTFFGKIEIVEPMTDIAGMSGGPVFAFQTGEDGKLRYWLHAIQSRWVSSERLIAACLARPLGVFLKEFMDGKHDDLVDTV